MSDVSEASTPFGLRLRYGAEAAAFFAGIGLFRAIGLDAASAVGGFVGRNILYRIRGVINRARTNLRAAFPEKPDHEIEGIVREMCDNLGRTIAEYAHLDKFSLHGPRPRIEVANIERALALKDGGRGVLFFSGHFANWELMPFVAVQAGFEGGEVYRPQNNPIIDRWLVAERAKNGPPEQVAKGPSGTRKIFTLLRRKRSVFLLADQKTNEGIAVPFFGREAMTTPAPAMIAMRLNAVLLPVSNERLSGSRFRMTVHEPIDYTPTGNEENDILVMTQHINDALEKAVRYRPSQWLWIHRRWPTAREQDQVRGKHGLSALKEDVV